MKINLKKSSIILILLLIYGINDNKFKDENKNVKLVFRDIYTELIDIQNYIDLVLNGTLLDKDKKYYLNNQPKISIVISVYNGEAFLKTAVLSIQNQDFKDIEIVVVDDCSKDNSVNLIKELMNEEPRIVLYQNDENKGALFTKCRGILLCKGKYIILLDEDDIFVNRKAFSILYNEAEKNKLDLLGFDILMDNAKLNIIKSNVSKPEPRIVLQPELSEKLFLHTSNGEIIQTYGNIVNYFVKKDIYVKAIKNIDEKYLNTKINIHDDFFIFYLLIQNANNCKNLDKWFYLVILDLNATNPKIDFRTKEKFKERENQKCLSFINFIEFILNKTKNTFYDKKVAFFNYRNLLLNNECRHNLFIKERAINISYLYLENHYINENDKNEIKTFLNQQIFK